MRFVPKTSVRTRLTLSILLVIALSWVVSSGTAYYFVYRDVQRLRQHMLDHPDIFPVPIPEPRFNIMDFVFGPGQVFREARPQPNAPIGPPNPNQPGIPGVAPRLPNPPPYIDRPVPLPGNQRGQQPPGPFGPRNPNQQGVPGVAPGLPNRPPIGNRPMPPLGGPLPPRGQQSVPTRPFIPPNMDARPVPQAGNPPPGQHQGGVPGWVIVYLRIATALILAIVAGAWLGRRFTRPLSALADGAKTFRAGDFGHRIEVDGDDEFTQVASAMNEMAGRVSNQISRLERDAERRRQLLADVAHELRSPVATMQTMSGALADGVADDPERRERAVTSLVTVSDRLANLVTDLLELAKLDLQELPLHRSRVDIREIASTCVQTHMARAAEAGVRLMNVVQGSPIVVHADPDRIAQVFDNLLDNAVSYAGKSAEVRVDLIDSNPAKVIISDTGCGIPRKHLSHVFDAFYRADAARTPGDSHSGLGLRIARGLIEAHGGELNLTSEEGRGTRVEISLPRSGSPGTAA